jgi:hypothetical protein
MSKAPENVAAFYAKLFGWKIEHRPDMNYRFVDTQAGAGINGGILRPDREGPWPGNMVLYVEVDDLAAYRRKVEEAGGTIHVKEQQVPGRGAFCLFTDPDGRMMGLWQAAMR